MIKTKRNRFIRRKAVKRKKILLMQKQMDDFVSDFKKQNIKTDIYPKPKGKGWLTIRVGMAAAWAFVKSSIGKDKEKFEC